MNISPNFEVSQNDTGLSADIPAHSDSELCVPTSIATYLGYEMGVKHALTPNASIPGISADLQSIDFNPLILDLANRCHTNFSTGTQMTDWLSCLGSSIQAYFGKTISVDLISPYTQTSSAFPSYVNLQARIPQVSDIRTALQTRDAIFAQASYSAFDTAQNAWVSEHSGHAFLIYGYDWESYFQNNMVDLKISNSGESQFFQYSSALYDPETAFHIQADSAGNAGQPLLLQGLYFPSQTMAAVLNMLIIVHITPDTTPSPSPSASPSLNVN